jgi:exonuclease SbcD
MRILHTSDWHLGRELYGQPRNHEFDSFLQWLLTTIQEQKVEALLIAGDIFHTTTPTTLAQAQYFKFLAQLTNTPCKQVVITAGNHDSPTFLDSPKEVLRFLNVHVVGTPKELSDLIIPLRNSSEEVEALICAVPYLRESDLNIDYSITDPSERRTHLAECLKDFYKRTVDLALNLKNTQFPKSALIGMGHLAVNGGKTLEEDGVRDTYIGGLNLLGTDLFPPELDYVALGHLHVPQVVQKKEQIRYSGSPIAMGFGEVGQKKSLCLIETHPSQPLSIQLLPVPVFQTLKRISGTTLQVQDELDKIKIEAHQGNYSGSGIWCEVHLKTNEFLPHFEAQIRSDLKGLPIALLKCIQTHEEIQKLSLQAPMEQLNELTPKEIFSRLISEHRSKNKDSISEEKESQLHQAFQTLLAQVQNPGETRL